LQKGSRTPRKITTCDQKTSRGLSRNSEVAGLFQEPERSPHGGQRGMVAKRNVHGHGTANGGGINDDDLNDLFNFDSFPPARETEDAYVGLGDPFRPLILEWLKTFLPPNQDSSKKKQK
jgi:hypothetical protein